MQETGKLAPLPEVLLEREFPDAVCGREFIGVYQEVAVYAGRQAARPVKMTY